MVNKILLSLILLLTTIPTVTAQEKSLEQISVPLHIDLSKTYGYCVAQTMQIEQIKKTYPSLSSQATRAQMEFNLAFNQSCENINSTLQNLLGEKWQAAKREFYPVISDSINSTGFNESQARTYIEEVTLRAQGQIPSPVLETLLAYNDEFQHSPAQEFLRGFKQIYRTRNHNKAKGLDFQIEYPKSWRAKEAERPNIIQIIESENGRGLDSITLTVKDLPVPAKYKFTEQELAEFFTAKSLREMLPAGARPISARPITLDGRSAGMVVFDQNLQRLDISLKMRFIQYVTIYKNNLILILCMTSTYSNDATELESKFKRLEPLFRLVGNSFVIQSQY